MLLPLFALAALSAVVLSDDSECSALTIVACAFLIDNDKIKDERLPETKEDLDSRCAATREGYKCLHDFSVKCPNMAELEHLGPYFQDQYHVLVQLCTDGNDLRNRYLSSAKCLNDHKAETDSKCGVPEETVTKAQCKKTQEILKCILGEVKINCGESTLNTMEVLLQPLEYLLIGLCKDASSNIPVSLHRALRMI